MVEQTTRYGISTTVDLPHGRAVEKTREELAKQGFGVLTEIDMQATLQQKLGEDVGPYIILGACSPADALKAVRGEPDIGLLLPCNVVVRAGEDGKTIVAAMDPEAALALADNAAIEPVAREVKERLRKVLEGVAAAA